MKFFKTFAGIFPFLIVFMLLRCKTSLSSSVRLRAKPQIFQVLSHFSNLQQIQSR